MSSLRRHIKRQGVQPRQKLRFMGPVKVWKSQLFKCSICGEERVITYQEGVGGPEKIYQNPMRVLMCPLCNSSSLVPFAGTEKKFEIRLAGDGENVMLLDAKLGRPSVRTILTVNPWRIYDKLM